MALMALFEEKREEKIKFFSMWLVLFIIGCSPNITVKELKAELTKIHTRLRKKVTNLYFVWDYFINPHGRCDMTFEDLLFRRWGNLIKATNTVKPNEKPVASVEELKLVLTPFGRKTLLSEGLDLLMEDVWKM